MSKLTKKKQLEIAFKKLLKEMLKSVEMDYIAPVVVDEFIQKLIKEVTIRTTLK